MLNLFRQWTFRWRIGKGIILYLPIPDGKKKSPELLTRANQSINYSIDKLKSNSTQRVGSFAEGLTGLAIVLSRLKHYKLLDSESVELLHVVEKALLDLVTDDSAKFLGYDYFYGLTGLGNYFINFSDCKRKKEIVKIICSQILAQAIEADVGLKWRDNYSFGIYPYNLGFAHGILSVITIFSKAIYKMGFQELHLPLTKATKWYLAQENDKDCEYRFSGTISEHGEGKNEKNWISWCYGDLSASIALIHSFNATGTKSYLEKAIAIASSTVKRKDIQNEIANYNGIIFEAGLCHGLAGVAASYYSLAQYFSDKQFWDSFEFWCKALLRRTSQEDLNDSSARCYRIGRRVGQENTFDPDLSLLDGAAGVGLLYCSVLKPSLHDLWAPVFLLDIYKKSNFR